MYNCLDSIPACDRQTDGQRDGWTLDRRTDILPRHSLRYAYSSRGKKLNFSSLVLNSSLLNYMTAHSTSLVQPTILVLFLMNTSFFQTQFRLCVNPAIFIFVNFDVSDNVIVLVQYDKWRWWV